MDYLVVLIPFLPIVGALIIGVGFIFNEHKNNDPESKTARIAKVAIVLACISAITLMVCDFLGKNDGTFLLGQWLASKTLKIELSFITSGFNVVLAALFSIILVVITQFSTFYLHKEPGFVRYLFILSLFSSGMMLIALSGNTILTFIGWEIAGLCSYFLISFAYNRPIATINATRVFITNRIGDASFILGIVLTFYYIGSTSWEDLNTIGDRLTLPTATVISFCFAVAAFAKSAQLPFTPWLARAMEGPTPSSAVFYGSVMIHSGVFLVILLQPVFERAPYSMLLLVVVGLVTAVYSFVVGLTQTDVKSSICFAITGQIGLMFMECGLGFWELASWHLCAHAIVRAYQVLSSPSLVFNGNRNPMRPVSQNLRRMLWLYNSSLQRFWLDPIIDRSLVRPINGLGRDLDYFDSMIIDRAMGSPTLSAVRVLSSLVQLEKYEKNVKLPYEITDFGRGNGVAGKLFEWTARGMSWFEERLVLQGIGMDTVNIGKKLGQMAIKLEQLLLKPRYLVLFVFVLLLIAATR